MPGLESEEDTAKRLAAIKKNIKNEQQKSTRNRKRIKNNDAITINNKTSNFISSKSSW